MKKKNYINWGITASLFVAFFVVMILVLKVDVQTIGPKDSNIGLASINKFFFEKIGVHMTLYTISDWIGILPIVVAATFAVYGIVLLFIKKSFKKIDFSLYVLAGLYFAVVLIYLFFEFVVVNRRPVLMDGYLEASFPSSHTLISICIMSTAMIMIHRLFKNKKLIIAGDVFCGLIMTTIVVLRFVSGVHWFSDILAGLVLAGALVMLFYTVLKTIDFYKAKQETK